MEEPLRVAQVVAVLLLWTVFLLVDTHEYNQSRA